MVLFRFTVHLKAGAYHYEWFNPSTGAVASSGHFTVGAGDKTFAALFAGDAVLYVVTATPTCSPMKQ